jgi:uncharacterized protein
MPASGSRLTSPAGLLEKEPRKVAAHNARLLGGKVLLTNDAGEHALLEPGDYSRYLSGRVGDQEELGKQLIQKDFVRDQLDFARLGEAAAERFLLRWPGPSVHTIVVTKRCNFKCVYCHASVVGEGAEGVDMTPETAVKAVDLAFASPNPRLTFEFQGGEPLLNWPVVKLVVTYAKLKNKHRNKELHFGLISNFSLLDDSKLDWLAEQGVSFCTSLDGPAALHNKNRTFLGGNSHELVVDRIKAIQARRAAGVKLDAPNAICTVSRFSLSQPEAVIDELVGLGLERVQLGPLDPIGFARRSWDAIGYTAQEYAAFYGRAIDHLIALNEKGVKAYEKMALILLLRVLQGRHWRFPYADGVARLAYDWDGAVYTAEDGRLLAADGDGFFKIGDVASSRYEDLLEHPTVKASLYASSPWSQPMCFQCAYNPFCTVQPVHGHATQGSLWGQMPTNSWCGKMMGVFDELFIRLQDPRKRKVLESWLEYKDR